MTLRPIGDDLYRLWPWVAAGLSDTARKTRQRYRPEHVYYMLVSGRAALYVFEHETPVGFMVVQLLNDPDGPVLFIFALWGALKKWKNDCYAEIEKLATTMKCVRTRMESTRRGWLREKFFVPTTTIYEHELRPA